MSTDVMTTSSDFTPEERAAYEAYKSGTEIKPPAPTEPPQQQTQTPPAQGQANTPPTSTEEMPAEQVNVEEVVTDDKGVTRDKKTGKFVKAVPYERFQHSRTQLESERTARKALEGTNKTLSEQIEILRNLSRAGAAPASQQTQERPAGPPKLEEDIFGHVKWLNDKIASLEKASDDRHGETQRTLEANRANTIYRDSAARYAVEKPDYSDAYKFAIENRATEILFFGKSNPQLGLFNADGSPNVEKLKSIIQKDERQLVSQAIANGANPAHAIYEWATVRGYKPKPKTETPPAQNGGANGQLAQSLNELERLKAAQANNPSLGGAGGAGTISGLTQEALANMSDTEYAARAREYKAKHGVSDSGWSAYVRSLPIR